MIGLAIGIASLAAAQGPAAPPPEPRPWQSEPYWRPRFNLGAVSVSGRPVLQAILGAEVGLRHDRAPLREGPDGLLHRGPRDWVGRTRVSGHTLYGLGTGSLGFDARLGSFVGPTSKAVTLQVGPDLWVNGYGVPGAPDYFLPPGAGVALETRAIAHVVPEVTAQVAIVPGWAFSAVRRARPIGPFHELSGLVLVAFQPGPFSIAVGYQRQYNAAGVFDGVIVSGGL